MRRVRSFASAAVLAVGAAACGSDASPASPTSGAATRNVFGNDVLLVEIVPTPGSGIEPGLAFTVSANGRVTP